MKTKYSVARRVQLYRRSDGVVIAYNLQSGSFLHDVVDYSIHLLETLHLDRETVYQRTVRIATFVEELAAGNIEYWQINNSILEIFRQKLKNYALRDVGKDVPDAIRRAEQTANATLQPTLSWLFWLSDRGLLLPNQIGPLESPITCTRTGPQSGRWKISSPLLFPWKRSGGVRLGKTPNDEQLDLAEEFLVETVRSEYCKQRNSLIFHAALESGLRADSLASLRCSQFDCEAIERSLSDTYPLVPDRQKFGYTTEYLIPLSLATKISDFISGARDDFVRDYGLTKTKTKDGLFLSEKTGEPIKARTLTTIISKAMRHAGLLPGSGAHALRRRFADDKITQEIFYRIENDLDTSSQSIAFALMQELGHTTTESLFKYISSHSARLHREAKSLAIEPLRTDVPHVAPSESL